MIDFVGRIYEPEVEGVGDKPWLAAPCAWLKQIIGEQLEKIIKKGLKKKIETTLLTCCLGDSDVSLPS